MLVQILITFISFSVLIYIGYHLSKTGVLRDTTNDDLTSLLVKVLVPFCIIASGNTDTGSSDKRVVLYTFLIIFAFYIVGTLVSFSTFKLLYKNKAGIYSNLAIFANTGFVGFPLASALLGEDALIYVVIFNLCYNLFLYSLGLRLFGGKTSLVKVLFSPLMLSSYFAILLFLSPFRFPSQIDSLIKSVGNSTMPVSMFILGSWLVGSNLKEWMCNKEGYVVNLFRLIILPLIMLFSMKALHFPQIATLSVVLIAALPIGTMNVILAKQNNLDYQNSNIILMQSMVLSLITIPLVMLFSFYYVALV